MLKEFQNPAVVHGVRALRCKARAEGDTSGAALDAIHMALIGLSYLTEVHTQEQLARLVPSLLDRAGVTPAPEVIDLGQTPQFGSERFAARGVRMSPRTLREKAIAAGLCYYVDKQVLISPRQLDAIWRRRPASRGDDGPGRSRTAEKAYQRALEKLTKKRNDRTRPRGGAK